MHTVKTQRFGELLVKDIIIIYFYMVVNSFTNLWKDWNKFTEIFHWKLSKSQDRGFKLSSRTCREEAQGQHSNHNVVY